MSGFTLILRDATSTTSIEHVLSFVGEDASGSFGIQANHTYFMTCLALGLARFRCHDADWQYLALPGGVLIFQHNVLNLCTRRYFLDTDYNRITEVLTQQLLAEEASLYEVKKSLAQLEQEMLKRLWKMDKL